MKKEGCGKRTFVGEEGYGRGDKQQKGQVTGDSPGR